MGESPPFIRKYQDVKKHHQPDQRSLILAKVIKERMDRQPDLLQTLKRWVQEQDGEVGDWSDVFKEDWPVLYRTLNEDPSRLTESLTLLDLMIAGELSDGST